MQSSEIYSTLKLLYLLFDFELLCLLCRFYQIIVVEHSKGSNTPLKDPDSYKPSMIGPYTSSTDIPYITAEFTALTSTFVVGDGKQYSKSKRKRRSSTSGTYTNVALKPETSYSVFQRAYVTSVFI